MPHIPGHPDPNRTNPAAVPAQTATPTVPVGAIGSTIADDSSGKVQQFFGNPANLATLLVGAAALASPKRGGESDLSAALRAGVGTLGFRGNLDREIETRREDEAEAASVITGREAQASAAQGQIAATRDRTGAIREQTTATSAAQAAELTAEQSAEQARLTQERDLANQQALVDIQNGALKAYSDALLNWQLTGGATSGIPQPDVRTYLQAGIQAAGLAGLIEDENLPDFYLDALDATGGGGAVVPAPGPTPGESTPTSDAVPPPVTTPPSATELRLQRNRARVVPARHRRLTGALTDAALNATVGQSMRRLVPEVAGSLSDDQIQTLVQQANLAVEERMPTMTPELARQILADPTQRQMLSQENIVALRGFTTQPRQPSFSGGRNL